MLSLTNYLAEDSTPQQQRMLLYVFFVVELLVVAQAGLVVTSSTDPDIIGEYNAVPNFFENNPASWNISGELVPIWRAIDMQDLTDKIIWVPRPQRWIWDEIAIPLQEKGALGIVVSPHHVFRKFGLVFLR